MDELKPCPFCGGKAELVHNAVAEPYTRYASICLGCRVTFDNWEIREQAIKAWNTRTALSPEKETE